MTTLTAPTTTSATTAAKAAGSGTSLLRSTRAEWRRLRHWSPTWILVATMLALALTFGYIFNYISYSTGRSSFSNDDVSTGSLLDNLLPAAVPQVALQGMPLFGGALMLVLGALVAAGGYGWGSWKTVFTHAQSRTSATVGALLATLGVVAITVTLTFALAMGAAAAVAWRESADLVWPTWSTVGQGYGAGLLIMGTWALAGFLLGTLARSTGLAVGLGMVWVLVVENLLRGVAGVLGAVESFTHILPGTAAGSLAGALIPDDARGDGSPGVLEVLGGAQATWTLMAYAVALPLLTLIVIRRRDVS